MAYQMQVLVVVIVMTVISMEAYEIKRDVVFPNVDSTYHRTPRLREFFLDQLFVDRAAGPQTSAVIPMRDRTVSQRALRDVSSKDRVIYSSGFSTFRHQPTKQNPFTVTSFRDKPLVKQAMPKTRKVRAEWASFADNPFEGPSLVPEEIFEGQASTYGSQAQFKEQLFTGAPFKSLFRGQLSPAEPAPFERQTTFVEPPSISSSIKFHRDVTPIDSYEQYKDMMTSLDGKSAKYDNQMPRLSPMVPSSEYLLPLNAEMPSSTPVIMQGHNPAMSSAFAGMGEAHSSDASKMELGTMLMSANNCNAPVDSSPTTVPSISVSTNQSSTVGHTLTSLTTKPSSPVMATSIAPSAGNVAGPTYFHATKYGAISSLPTLSELNGDMDSYALSHTPKNGVKINEHDFKLLALEAPKNVEIQNSMLNYVFPEEHKSELKGIQNSFVDYALPVKLKHGWPLQQFSQPETSSTYAPLFLNGKTKLILPSIPAPASWPVDIKSDVSTTLPMKSIPDAATRNNMPLGIDLPVDFTAGIPNSLPTSRSNGISGSITSGISTGIPGGMTTDIPANIPTLNLGQSLHHVEQLRQAQETRNPWYPTGLQLQLGGFGGINYTLHTGNTAAKPMEPGIARAGLTSPKLPQPHDPAFAKIGVGYHL